nr:hypothetical protein [Tanacetum cinerariifolium]
MVNPTLSKVECTSTQHILESLNGPLALAVGFWMVRVCAFKIFLGRSKLMVITKARTLNGGSRSFLLKASATTFAFPG